MASKSKQKPKTHEFKAEIKQLLDILVHSVYTSKDIFVRELISNATDALEKLRFSQVEGTEIYTPDAPLEIRIETKRDSEGQRLVISDSGIGMTEEEVRENIGTIAHSGAAAFLEQFRRERKEEEAKGDGDGGEGNLSLIGRFGVGFYSVFMAAEKVVLTSRTANPQGQPVRWTSDGLGSYTVETLDEEAPRGTRVEVYLKKDEERFAEDSTVKSAIHKYSNFVPFPIFVGDEQVNKITALWREPPPQIKDEQLSEFYKFVSHDFQDPILKLHYSVDAPVQFSALLFVPKTDTEVLGFGEGEVKLQLYVKRVLIDSENKDLLPKYLRFVKGVVESEDLPLNISRETLQENSLVIKIRDTLTRKLLDLFLKLAAEKPEEYKHLWETFGRILKEGHNDFGNRESFQELLRFNSSRHDDAKSIIGLGEYAEAMPKKQKAIYYLSGASREALQRDPRLELFRKKGVEVLYLYELADEFVLGTLGKYKEKLLVSADQVKPGDLKDLGDKDREKKGKRDKKAKADEEKVDIKPLIGRFKEVLGDRVADVRESERLVDSPACLVGDESQLSGHMDKVLRLIHKDTALPKRVLELNPDHPLVRNLARLVQKDAKDPFIERACEQLFEGSMLVDGYLTDPHELVRRMHEVLDDAAALKAGGAAAAPP